MFIDIKPTTTPAALTHNNTSAADSFAGWPNGVSKPGNVSHEPLGIPQLALAHDVNWWGTKSHPDIGYNSADPVYISKKITDFQARGINGATWLWHGTQSQEHKACLAALPLYEQAGLKFCLMIGSSTPTLAPTLTQAQRTTNLINILAFFRTAFLKSAAYIALPDKRPIVMFFGITGVDWTAVSKAGADMAFLFRWEQGYGNRAEADGYFGWRSCDEAWITAVKKYGKPVMLGLNGGFDSSHKEAPILCSWGNTSTTAQQGGLRMQSQLALALAHPEITMAQLVTLNDYQEGSALEPGLASGVTIGLELSSGVLNWNGGPMFAHYDVLVSADGENFMPLTRSQIPMLVDLDELEFKPGSYWFAVLATGKPFVQNVLSNVVKTSLTWV